MTAVFVLDASITLTWAFQDQATRETLGILDRLESETAVVPNLWFLELTNVLAIAGRKGRITEVQTTAFFTQLMALDFEVDADVGVRAFTEILPLCNQHTLTSYDAVYLEVAIRRQLPLATLDESLHAACNKVGIPVLGR
jgi:predicted nucleic acid-binding protein